MKICKKCEGLIEWHPTSLVEGPYCYCEEEEE